MMSRSVFMNLENKLSGENNYLFSLLLIYLNFFPSQKSPVSYTHIAYAIQIAQATYVSSIVLSMISQDYLNRSSRND